MSETPCVADGLDPDDWDALRSLGHRMLDDMFDHLAGARSGAVWRPLPHQVRDVFKTPAPRDGSSLESVYEQFRNDVQPYATGNIHPRFMGWVHGGGTAVGMLADMLAAGLNANLGGRDHAPVEVERQVIRWSAELLGMPSETSGILVTGSSMANFIGILVARLAALGPQVRHEGVGQSGFTAYAGANAHGCIPRAMDMAGFGSDALRSVPLDDAHCMRLDALAAMVAEDRAQGRLPALVIATAGSVDTGAIDDLDALATFCAAEGMRLHVDGAFGAMLALSPVLRHRVNGLARADSIAFDFHKWPQVPYDAGCVLVRDPVLHRQAFAQDLAYLRRDIRGLSGGAPWPCDLGPDLSRGFRALKVWMMLKTYGADRLGAVVETCCDVATHLAARVAAEPELELLAPLPGQNGLNVVCFRFIAAPGDLDRLNIELVADVQESGVAVPSTTHLRGTLAIRAAIVNHRTRREDADILVNAVLKAGRCRVSQLVATG
ncbi:pyridoxal phosphate-dependent decarboxylase family protein [Granulibacter bethesdensis]|uniref:Tyrosine decarboxylase n=1 Tax=Granulibacter bethesdensis (strain ATCC BAA-1260 / CGDNIH1) TaxID=391165 RepID=Q0BU86_GRABC|nr:pyridoxal-dependent decarboxylase [Granulibacter bethesdensis]ABI61616.1 Tyrosine decarboxylase [Granulibacter bethesdensis CGDNIH1]APH51419.1 Tyrosine decarboxylase [Granulibacter bethesdensis]APH64112.1 Tyrosine decarboxylase [Granulibacter bethesdensis]